MLVYGNPLLEKLHKLFDEFGTQSRIIADRTLDFEYDFTDSFQLASSNGVCSLGALKLNSSPIDYVHVLKLQKLEDCQFVPGGNVGLGKHVHSWFKVRYFLSFPNDIQIGPLDIGTITTIKHERLRNKVEEYFWHGYGKLTTLPPGILRDNLVEMLGADNSLNELLEKYLLKERVIKIKRYTPQIQTGDKSASITNSKIVIESGWKLQKDIVSERENLELYYTMAFIIKTAVNNLQYHLSMKY